MDIDETIKILLPAIIAIFGFLFLGYRLAILTEAFKSKDWLRANGKILFSTIQVSVTRNNNTDSKTYKADISYAYRVGQKELIGTQVYVGDDIFTCSLKKPSRLVNEYPKDKETTVFYNPEKPEEAVLIPGVDSINWVLVIVGFVIMVLGLWFLNFEAVKDTINQLIKEL